MIDDIRQAEADTETSRVSGGATLPQNVAHGTCNHVSRFPWETCF